MYFSEFLVLMISSTIVVLLLMYLGEKIMTILTPGRIRPFYKIVGSLIFAIGSIAIVSYLFTLSLDFYYFLIAGAIILFNKYWLGHFTEVELNLKVTTTNNKKVVE